MFREFLAGELKCAKLSNFLFTSQTISTISGGILELSRAYSDRALKVGSYLISPGVKTSSFTKTARSGGKTKIPLSINEHMYILWKHTSTQLSNKMMGHFLQGLLKTQSSYICYQFIQCSDVVLLKYSSCWNLDQQIQNPLWLKLHRFAKTVSN